MNTRVISVSAAPYDGYAVPEMLSSLARCGASHVEPAFIVGYTEPFDETSFSSSQAKQWQSWLQDAGLGCDAFSSHIDLGEDKAVEVFLGRMDFAKALGARIINTNAAKKTLTSSFYKNIEVLARHAADIGLQIGLENPGDGSDNLINTAADAPAVLARIGSAYVGLNYDAGNTQSHRPEIDATADGLQAMRHCLHTHIKNVSLSPGGYVFSPMDEGLVDCASLLQYIAGSSLNMSIEIPLRLHRQTNAQPVRADEQVPLNLIESRLISALSFVDHHLETAKPVSLESTAS